MNADVSSVDENVAPALSRSKSSNFNSGESDKAITSKDDVKIPRSLFMGDNKSVLNQDREQLAGPSGSAELMGRQGSGRVPPSNILVPRRRSSTRFSDHSVSSKKSSGLLSKASQSKVKKAVGSGQDGSSDSRTSSRGSLPGDNGLFVSKKRQDPRPSTAGEVDSLQRRENHDLWGSLRKSGGIKELQSSGVGRSKSYLTTSASQPLTSFNLPTPASSIRSATFHSLLGPEGKDTPTKESEMFPTLIDPSGILRAAARSRSSAEKSRPASQGRVQTSKLPGNDEALKPKSGDSLPEEADDSGRSYMRWQPSGRRSGRHNIVSRVFSNLDLRSKAKFGSPQQNVDTYGDPGPSGTKRQIDADWLTPTRQRTRAAVGPTDDHESPLISKALINEIETNNEGIEHLENGKESSSATAVQYEASRVASSLYSQDSDKHTSHNRVDSRDSGSVYSQDSDNISSLIGNFPLPPGYNHFGAPFPALNGSAMSIEQSQTALASTSSTSFVPVNASITSSSDQVFTSVNSSTHRFNPLSGLRHSEVEVGNTPDSPDYSDLSSSHFSARHSDTNTYLSDSFVRSELVPASLSIKVRSRSPSGPVPRLPLETKPHRSAPVTTPASDFDTDLSYLNATHRSVPVSRLAADPDFSPVLSSFIRDSLDLRGVTSSSRESLVPRSLVPSSHASSIPRSLALGQSYAQLISNSQGSIPSVAVTKVTIAPDVKSIDVDNKCSIWAAVEVVTDIQLPKTDRNQSFLTSLSLDIVVLVDTSIYTSPACFAAAIRSVITIASELDTSSDRISVIFTATSAKVYKVVFPLQAMKDTQFKSLLKSQTHPMSDEVNFVQESMEAAVHMLQKPLDDDQDEHLPFLRASHIFVLSSNIGIWKKPWNATEDITFHLASPAIFPWLGSDQLEKGWSHSSQVLSSREYCHQLLDSGLCRLLRRTLQHARFGTIMEPLPEVEVTFKAGQNCQIEEVVGQTTNPSLKLGQKMVMFVNISVGRGQLGDELMEELLGSLGAARTDFLVVNVSHKHPLFTNDKTRVVTSSIGVLRRYAAKSEWKGPQNEPAINNGDDAVCQMQQRLAYHVAANVEPRRALEVLDEMFGFGFCLSVAPDYIGLLADELRYRASACARYRLGWKPREELGVSQASTSLPRSDSGDPAEEARRIWGHRKRARLAGMVWQRRS
ncbi:MAG: hypothetical protein M1814_005511 [Vezdaea aestivalis]|nr:MAG: hypothetical protein M1814_005511 [Vezdaea aestivalis]